MHQHSLPIRSLLFIGHSETSEVYNKQKDRLEKYFQTFLHGTLLKGVKQFNLPKLNQN